MKGFMHFSGAVAGLVASMTVAPAALAAGNLSPQAWGESPNEIIDRVVNITPQTRSVGVYRNDIVKFIDASSGQVFVVRADTPDGAFNLNQLMGPDLVSDRQVLVYVRDAVGNASG